MKITKEKYEGNDEYNDLFEIEIKDLTFLEGSQYIYRFSFDVEMNWRESSERVRDLIKDVEVKTEVENG